ncbi:P-type conjugative transfer protein TrbG [Sphingosinicella terrae]|uniref:P-type conjugative transfer protein TrbG n=1 Tax=Sphingosinicella terrae TaxID=2172047 RepID=UPI000E0D5AF9|nr:P-type conjugative transfer protein TrbG [Sphingosinicella terrae]
MTPNLLLAMTSVLGLGACVGSTAVEAARPEPATAAYARAILVPDAQPEPDSPAATAPVPVEQLLPAPDPARRRAAGPPVSRVEAANRAATREPSRDHYVNAVQVYAWTEGALYRLYTAPERVSDIALQPGEALVSVAAGDTARWVIGDTTSGAGAQRRTHILVKPSAVGLRTNLVISTDRRVYHVQLESTPRTAMASISWTYPEGELLALRNGGAADAEPAVAAGVAVEALQFGYRIQGDDPPWRPLRAFDDGSQVFIEFPSSLAQGEAPPLFVLGQSGRAELVNYRVRGRYYVVDRLFAAAELRLGERRQQVVRIVRDDEGGPRRRRGRPS